MEPSKLEELKNQLKDLLDAGFIRLSKVPCGVSILFHNKSDGSLCLDINYRALNKVTVMNKYPSMKDLFDQLGRGLFFSKPDLLPGYY